MGRVSLEDVLRAVGMDHNDDRLCAYISGEEFGFDLSDMIREQEERNPRGA